MTDRIGVAKSAPSTNFYLECDRDSQSIAGNYTRLRFRLRAVNAGSTGSYSNYPGRQFGSVDGIGTFADYQPNPFLPSGYANGQVRWDIGPYYLDIPHNADGTRGAVTLRMGLYYDGGGVAEEHTVSFNDFPAIPRGPRVEDGGIWKPSLAYAEDAGVWKQCLVYAEVANAWKQVGS